MMKLAGIEAALLWQLIKGGADGILKEPSEDYAGMLERMEAGQLLKLLEQVQERLKVLGAWEPGPEPFRPEPEKLFIGKDYSIRLGGPSAPKMPFRPLVRAIFILFLRHPEGICLKERGRYREELEDIYAAIAPNVDAEDRRRRIGRLVNLEDNSFSEKTSVLNATLDKLLPGGAADQYKVQGYNGHPRRIPLCRVMVEWE